MKNHILVLGILCYSFLLFGQEEQHLEIVVADSTWNKEIITFPIAWAPDLTLNGFEELRFAPEWDQPDSPQFWSLALAWKVNANSALTLKQITFNLEHYFDSLMKPNHWATKFPDPTLTLLLSTVINGQTTFTGQMSFFDGFHTGKSMTIKIKATQWFCESTETATVLFQFSPQPKNHEIWKKLNTIVPIKTACIH